MANEEQLSILKQGVDVWNKWREEHPNVDIDLSGVNLAGVDLKGINLEAVNLLGANLRGVDLSIGRPLETELNLDEGSVDNLNTGQLLTIFNYPLGSASSIKLSADELRGKLAGTSFKPVLLRRGNLREVNLSEAELRGADLREIDLRGANLLRANLSAADLSGADLRGTNLMGTILVNAKVDKARLSGSSVYAVNVWDLQGEFAEQDDLIITGEGETVITVDNIEVAQFIYLVLNNEKLRDVINTITSKSVLILGRFAIPERKEILDALRNKLREYNLLPIVFDFDRPIDKDFTETIKTLAGLSYFVIADVTNPKSSPLELQATVPDYQIPFVPIIQEGESPFAMMVDLQKKYNWVLDTLSYNSIETLIKALKPAIIDPAIQKHNELRIIKAREPKIRSANDFIEDKGLSYRSSHN